MEDLGNSRDGVGMYADGTVPLKPRFKSLGEGGLSSYRLHASARGGVDGGAGGLDR